MSRIVLVLGLLTILACTLEGYPVSNIQTEEILKMLRLGDYSYFCSLLCDPDDAKMKSLPDTAEKNGADARLFCWLCDDMTTIAPTKPAPGAGAGAPPAGAGAPAPGAAAPAPGAAAPAPGAPAPAGGAAAPAAPAGGAPAAPAAPAGAAPAAPAPAAPAPAAG